MSAYNPTNGSARVTPMRAWLPLWLTSWPLRSCRGGAHAERATRTGPGAGDLQEHQCGRTVIRSAPESACAAGRLPHVGDRPHVRRQRPSEYHRGGVNTCGNRVKRPDSPTSNRLQEPPPKLSATASRSCHRRVANCGHRQHPVNNLTTPQHLGMPTFRERAERAPDLQALPACWQSLLQEAGQLRRGCWTYSAANLVPFSSSSSTPVGPT